MAAAVKLPIKLQYGVEHDNLMKAIEVVLTNQHRTAISGATLLSLVDNSTGVDTAGAVPAIGTFEPFVHASGSDLAQKAAFDTAIGKTNNAVAVLKGIVNQMLTTLDLSVAISGGNGTVATAGTVPAQDKSVTGVDGASTTALERLSANQQMVVARNNIATIIKALNYVAINVGYVTLADNSGGNASPTYALTNPASTASGVDASGATCAKAAVDIALDNMADGIATIMAYIDDLQTACDTLRTVEFRYSA